jgi:hypothetical protein
MIIQVYWGLLKFIYPTDMYSTISWGKNMIIFADKKIVNYKKSITANL